MRGGSGASYSTTSIMGTESIRAFAKPFSGGTGTPAAPAVRPTRTDSIRTISPSEAAEAPMMKTTLLPSAESATTTSNGTDSRSGALEDISSFPGIVRGEDSKRILFWDLDDTLVGVRTGEGSVRPTGSVYDEVIDSFVARMVLLGYDIDAVRQSQFALSCELYRSRGFSDLDCFPCSFSGAYESLAEACGEDPCPEMAAEFEALAREAYEVQYAAYPGALEVLSEMRAAGFTNVVVTKGELAQQSNKLAQSGLADQVDAFHVVCHKNSRDWVRVLKQNGINSLASAGHSWAIGNSIKSDVNIPLLLGCNGLHLESYTWEFEQADLGLACPGRYAGIIQDLRQVPAVIHEHS